MAKERGGSNALRRALIDAVEERSAGLSIPDPLPTQDPISFTRAKVEPLVRGLFPMSEQEVVLALIERSVVFLTPETIRPSLEGMMWLHSAWDLANLYLGSLGAGLLSEEAPRIVGMSVETTCYVSLEYFTDTSRFSDYVVHEVAHIFHNCKRRTVGLRETRSREWLLELEYRKRETFAYCCEAYSRILALASRASGRPGLVDELVKDAIPDDERIDALEYVDILREAAVARNGWKRILARCSPAPGRLGSFARRAEQPRAPVTAAENRRAIRLRAQ
jgi:hypothetical protein